MWQNDIIFATTATDALRKHNHIIDLIHKNMDFIIILRIYLNKTTQTRIHITRSTQTKQIDSNSKIMIRLRSLPYPLRTQYPQES